MALSFVVATVAPSAVISYGYQTGYQQLDHLKEYTLSVNK